MSEFTVRLAAETDKEAVLALLGRYLEEMRGYPLTPQAGSEQQLAIETAIKRGLFRGDPIVLAFAQERPVGCSWWAWLPGTPKNDLAALGTYVEPSFRKRGVAKAMRALAEGEAKAQGFKRIVGSVHPGNVAGTGSLSDDWRPAYIVVVKEL